MTFDPLRWVVPQYLVEGLTILAGKPKVGKSFLALDVAAAVASGGMCLGQQCEQGDVLALFLEDSKRRLQRRLTTMLGVSKEAWPARLKYATEWPPLAEGGLDLIRAWVGSVPKPRLVIIDILERVRTHNRSQQKTQYAADYEALATLQSLAAETQLSVLVLHHQRKMGAEDLIDTVSGTLGIGGAVDAFQILGTDDTGHFLFGRGRDQEPFAVAVQQDVRCCWQVLGPKPDAQASPERGRIVAALAKAGRAMTVEEIAAAVGQKKANVKNLLSKLHFEREIERVATGTYRIVDPQANLALDDEVF
jgi:AAA domain